MHQNDAMDQCITWAKTRELIQCTIIFYEILTQTKPRTFSSSIVEVAITSAC